MTATPTMLGLPSGGRNRPAHVASAVALFAGVAELMLVGALVSGLLNVRALSDTWPAEGAKLDNYLGTMLFVTAILSGITVEWAVYALRRGNRRQALSAAGITVGFGLAFLNLLWYSGREFAFGPADHSYAVFVYALHIAMGVIVLIGIAFLLVAIARIAGDQVTAGEPSVLRAAAWHWHVVAGAWLIAYMALYLLQNT